ncbi:MAG: hypothetical protein JNL08_03830 [Planctomycetes bacterium]|nr:hypothetical protein [Planctomycetota bacterium]
MPSSRWSWTVLALLLAHLVWGLARVPRVTARRAADIADYRQRGAADYLLADARLDGAPAIAELAARTGAGQRLGRRGTDRGVVEFAAALLWPRLLVTANADAGTPVLVATRTALVVAPQ